MLISHIWLFVTPWPAALPGLPVLHQLPELTQTHVHWVSDAIQPSHPLSSPSPPALNLSQHQGLSNESVLHIRCPDVLVLWTEPPPLSPIHMWKALIHSVTISGDRALKEAVKWDHKRGALAQQLWYPCEEAGLETGLSLSLSIQAEKKQRERCDKVPSASQEERSH